MNLTPEELRRLMDGNPDIYVLGETDAPQPVNNTQGKNTQPAQESPLAVEFKRLWAILDGPELVQEYQFHGSRRWRLDFAHLESKVGIEVHGGIHANGRHTRGTGFENDREKVNAAIFLGWDVFELTTKFLTPDYLEEIMRHIEDRMNDQKYFNMLWFGTKKRPPTTGE